MRLDEHYMRRCLDLASFGKGNTSPNPMVGAVIVWQDTIVGEGFTSPYGGAHAEVNAIAEVIERYGDTRAREIFKQSTIYVSLEPCAHFGKTPPCATLIVDMEFRTVVIACLDPFSKVNGLGVEKIREAGIETKVGVLEEEAKWLNRRFFTRVKQARPYIILKWAETADGYFSPADQTQRWISNKASKQLVHKWRAEEDAILVGKNTAMIDDPALTVRRWRGKNPKRILIDRNLAVSPESKLFNDQAETIVFNAQKTDWNKHLKYIELENFDLYFPEMTLYQLYLMDVQSIIIEGGRKTLDAFIERDLWDEARVLVGKQSWGTGLAAPAVQGQLWKEVSVGSDRLRLIRKSSPNDAL
ncbi:MAG: bifunctional diaminohydroxyphosphoribosylaminopyrimidine deaminase/5-amino-6-(5-phosphoribosylamino)uracil reductase RibD [Sphingobacteriaceae bacterium]